MKRALIVFALAASATPAFAKAKRTKPRVLLFDASDAKKSPTFEFTAKAPEKVSMTPIMFATKLVDSDDPDAVSVSEKNLMLDQGKTEKPKKKKK